MKKFLGISIETNIGFLIMFLIGVGLSVFVGNEYWVGVTFVAVCYFGIVYYFKYVFPYRPFQITIGGNYYRVGELLTAGYGMPYKYVKILKVLRNTTSGCTYLVKPLRKQPINAV